MTQTRLDIGVSRLVVNGCYDANCYIYTKLPILGEFRQLLAMPNQEMFNRK